MTKYVGICPSSAGFFSAKQVEVEAETVEQAKDLIWQEIIGSRYISRIIQLPERVTVWDEHQPTRLAPDKGQAAVNSSNSVGSAPCG